MAARTMTPTATPGIYRRGQRYVVVLRDLEGRQFKRFAETLAAARELKATLSADFARGEVATSRRVTFSEYAEEWMQTFTGRTSRGIREHTMAGYRAAIEQEAIPFFGARYLCDI